MVTRQLWIGVELLALKQINYHKSCVGFYDCTDLLWHKAVICSLVSKLNTKNLAFIKQKCLLYNKVDFLHLYQRP